MMRWVRIVKCVGLVGLFGLVGSFAYAGITGKIAGKIIDKSTGESLPGANVVIEDMALGAAADKEGHYYIVNVGVGTYTVKASMIGYRTEVKEDVKVSADFTTTVNFELQPTAIEMEVVTVKAERPMVIPDATTTTRISTGKAIETRATPDYKAALSSEAGVVFTKGGTSGRTAGFHIRGGRGDEVVFMVDGMSVQDRLTASSYQTTDVEVSTSSIKEMEVMTGGFSAEYGQAMSGVVNIVTKEGSRPEGLFRYRTDGLFAGYMDEGNKGLEATIGGPAPFNRNLLFFFSGDATFRNQDQYWDFPLVNTKRDFYSAHGKATYKFTPSIKGVVSGFLSREQWGNWGTWPKTGAVEKYVPSEYKWAMLRKLTQLQTTLTHSLTPTMFHELKVGYFTTHNITGERDWEWESNRKWYEDYKFKPWWTYTRARSSDWTGSVAGSSYEDNFWYAKYWDPEKEDSVYYYPHGVTGLFSMGEPGAMEDRNTKYWGIDWDITSQLTKHHQIKCGTDWKLYTLKRLEVQYVPSTKNVPVIDSTGRVVDREIEPKMRDPKNCLYWNKYDVNPYESAVYIQDKIEYPGYVINIGIRWDLFEPKAWKYVNPLTPFRPDTTPEGNDTLVLDTITAQSKHQFSPRFGISFPVTERTVFRLSYGHFFQIPLLRYMYDSHNMNLLESRGAWPLIGNPDSKHQKTVQYEFGLAHQLTEVLAMDISVFYKDMYGLLGTRYVPAPLQSYSWYTVEDYGNVKGMEFVLRKRETSWLSGRIAYTLQFANGTASHAREAYYDYIANAPVDPITGEMRSLPKTAYPLEFDERHAIATETRITIPSEVKYFGGMFFNLENTIGSGTPYTKRDANGNIIGVTNEKRMPGSWTTNLRIEKYFALFGQKLNAFAEIENLFNRKNIQSVYSTTGDPSDPGTIDNYDYYIENTFPDPYQKEGKVPVFKEGGEHSYRKADERRDLDGDGYITKDEWYQSYKNAWYDRYNEPGHFSAPVHINIGIAIRW